MVKPSVGILCCAALMNFGISHANEAPSIELLEYLADLEKDNDEWIDPLKMKEIANNEIKEPLKETGNE